MIRSSLTIARRPGMVLCLLLATAAGGPGCSKKASDREVVVYCALDAEFSDSILDAYEQETGVDVREKMDVESTKTVGLVNRIIGEKRNPRCDIFWNNEILHTLRLQRMGLLQPYKSDIGGTYPEDYRSPQGYWYGFAARARVLIVNTELVPETDRPDSLLDLIDPRWKNQVGIAKPLFGTTATHAAVLFASWGTERAEQFFRDVKQNAQIMGGNKQVALAVGRGELAFGITDTDDAIIELENGQPVAIIYPDQKEGAAGTLFIPNTLSIIRDGPNTKEAQELLDHLLTAEIEKELAVGRSAQFPVNPAVKTRSRVDPADGVRWMEVDFEAAAEHWDEAAAFLEKLFSSAP